MGNQTYFNNLNPQTMNYANIYCPSNGPFTSNNEIACSVNCDGDDLLRFTQIYAVEGFNDVNIVSTSYDRSWCYRAGDIHCKSNFSSTCVMTNDLAAVFECASASSDKTCDNYIVSLSPTLHPIQPTDNPTNNPSSQITPTPTIHPTFNPTIIPTLTPTKYPTINPTITLNPTIYPTINPTITPSDSPSQFPSKFPSMSPSQPPVNTPLTPTITPGINPTINPTNTPTNVPTFQIMSPTLQAGTTPSPVSEGGIIESTNNIHITKFEQNRDNSSGGILNGTMIGIIIASVVVLCCIIFGIIMLCKKKNKSDTYETDNGKGKTEKNMNIQMQSVPSKEINDNDCNSNIIQNKPQYDVITAGEDDIIDMDENNNIFTPDGMNPHTKYLSAAQKRDMELYPTPNDNENNKYKYLSQAQKKRIICDTK
eukprot:980238_1